MSHYDNTGRKLQLHRFNGGLSCVNCGAREPVVSSFCFPDRQSQNKRYTPQQYARLKAQRLDRERVTGNSERGKRL